MNSNSGNDRAFIARLTSVIEANLGDENFGVNELAEKIGLNRSQVHRRLKKATNKSVSQFIREMRLGKAKELLEKGNLTVSEIAYNVGFGSPSYFIRSFHDYFGYPPGEAKNLIRQNNESENEVQSQSKQKRLLTNHRKLFVGIAVITVFLTACFIYYIFTVGSSVKIDNHNIEKSILVLPLNNFSPEKSDSIFSNMLSFEIRSRLVKIKGLNVISSLTANQLRQSKLSSPEIARKVNADFILDGSIQNQDKDLLINIQLIDALHDRILWPGNYNRKYLDILGIEDDIAINVANSLQLFLPPEEIKQIKKLRSINPEAEYNCRMGQYLCHTRNVTSIQDGIKYFEKAIEIDSNYTVAYAGLADAYYALAFTGNVERKAGYDKAYKLAEKALEKDSMLAEAYAVKGVVSYFGYWEWEKARGFLEKALEVDSNCMVAHLYYSSFLDIVGEPDKALQQVNKAIELEPLYFRSYFFKGLIYRNAKKYAESTDALMMSSELGMQAYAGIFFNYLHLNNDSLAIEYLQKHFSSRPVFQKYTDDILPAYKSSGMNGVLKLLLKANLELKYPDLRSIASIYNMLGMQNEALTYLEKACRIGQYDVPRIIRYSKLENLYSEPRFQALVDTMNLRLYFPKPSK
ncbi:helix-turn-helix domain-containing protein [Maribellus mangrovi]|uniref:helix-turn-helix domain-containing protein n=1 Tax=Maribellus mangrovi TaxID=3133146 RepID=UPI0030EF0342